MEQRQFLLKMKPDCRFDVLLGLGAADNHADLVTVMAKSGRAWRSLYRST
jgi:hypothetical protein